MSFERIPAELRALPQWIMWRYVTRDDGKPTKLPYDAKTGRLARVNDSATWATFEACFSAMSSGNYSGLGFVLTPDDPYVFVDLDDPFATLPDGRPKFSDAQAIFERQQAIAAAMDTYSEYSVSGRGLHIIGRGKVLTGKRRGAVELYSDDRYMAMTGNVYRDAPITDQQMMADWLFSELGGAKTLAAAQESMLFTPDPDTDENVLKHAFSAANGAKFQALWEGRWFDAGLKDNSWSAGDFALIDMLQFHTSSRQQIRRLFMQSGLAARDKAKRTGYVEYMIQRSFDRQPAEVDIQALIANADAYQERQAHAREAALEARGNKHAFSPEVAPETARPAPPGDAGGSPYLRPLPGLLGAVAWFIYQAAPRPVPEIAVAGAIGLLAGIVGRAFNVNSTGLNCYILLLAKTGRGKEAIATGIGRLMQPVKQIDGGGGGVPGADEFLGPQEIASGQALIKYMAKTSRSFVSIISEFDGFMYSLTARNVSPAVAKLKQVLLSSYSRSGHGQRLDKSIYSESDKNVPMIPSPAISIVGEGTPGKFYELLHDDLIADGFLPRFSVIEYDGPRTQENPNFAIVRPSADLVQAIARLSAHCLSLNSKDQVQNVDVTPEAKAMLDAFNRECDLRINSANDTISQLWNRAHLKALKLAALIAVGVNWYSPMIDAAGADWAIACARHDTTRLASRFEQGHIGLKSADVRQLSEIKKRLKALFERKTVNAEKYRLTPDQLGAGVFNTLYIQPAVSNLNIFKEDRRGGSVAFREAIASLIRMGIIDEISRADKDRLGVIGAAWIVKDWDWLNSGDDA